MKRVREAQSTIAAAIEPGGGPVLHSLSPISALGPLLCSLTQFLCNLYMYEIPSSCGNDCGNSYADKIGQTAV